MKRVVCLVLFLAAVPALLSSQDLLITGSLDWQISIRAGIEYPIHPRFGLKGDLGLSLFGLLVGDAFFLFYLFPHDRLFRLALLLGIPNAGIPLSFNAAMVSLGASLLGGCRLSPSLGLDLRVGAGYPFFFERGKEVIRDTQLPLNLWPDVTIGVSIRISPQEREI